MELSNVISIGRELVWLPLIAVCIAFIPYLPPVDLAPSSQKVLSCLVPRDNYHQG